MAELALDVLDLRCSYGAFEAVRGVSFQVASGELFALLGTNGAGKTTTIEVLEGLQSAAAGRVRVLGRDPRRDRRALRRHTGVMLQDGGLTGQLTVRESVQVWRGLTHRPRTTDEVLDLVGLSPRSGVAVEQLSGGERRRLELALAVLGRPQLLFLDEPTTGMDPASRRTTWDVIRRLRSDGTTVLLTTHYLDEAEALADRVAIMHAGRIATIGTPDDVVTVLPARISFLEPTGLRPPELPHATVAIDEGRVGYQSSDVQVDLAYLLDWARDHGVTLRGLTARSASLEDVLLDIAANHTAADKAHQ
ncbi:ABC transporter ATP-binding protein [Jiangella ureilytica]|uniref:ABC transporter ATP-binding protein n=1 Tax=Jiangella ureilytica TaxID=2530374 RepID=A0A4R4S4P1_9ACTN|nr:ABC transporter ATP-binding protein [Jiangella ureilytica]TDC57004.1 ABC transporter ATP-binding protein [Jiangella ureilytica]